MELDITRIAAGGDGIGRAEDGRVVLCEGALPGERVEAVVVLERRDFVRARTVAVLRPSPDRQEPECPHVAAGCGGCTWPYVRPGGTEAQLKAAIVVDALRRIAHLPDVAVRVAATVPERAYRTTVRLGVDARGRPAYRRRHGHELVAVDSCLVAHPLLEELIVGGRFRGAGGVLLRVGVAGGERVACPDRRTRGVTVPQGAVVATVGDPRAQIHEEVAGRRWRVSAGSFFQSGPVAAEALVRAVAAAVGDGIGPGARIADLYAGVGLLGGALAGRVEGVSLVAVESSRVAARDAVHNLADVDARVVVGEVADAVPDLGLAADVVVADPARTGLGPAAAAAVASIGAPLVVLVSCDPASLARDAVLLAGQGYVLDGVDVVDVFPSTFHVETVSRFRAAR